MTQALDGVILSAVAVFGLSTSSELVVLDVLGASFALVGSMLGLLLSRNLRGGLLQKPIQILALSPLLITVAEILDVSEYLTGSIVILLLHGFVELLFLVVLFLGLFMLYRTMEGIGEAGKGSL